jgi:putative phosphoesterase
VKIAFISDIHGNAFALDAVIADIKKQKVDKIYVLGDICYRGPEPKRALDLVRSLDTDVIKGNADVWVVRGVKEGEVPEKVLNLMNAEREWTVEKLNQADINYLDSLPTYLSCVVDEIKIVAFHATPDNLFETVLPNSEDETLESRLIRSSNANIFVYAHIHIPYIRFIQGKVIMNIGSVGLPFDGLTKASYGIVEIKNNNLSTSIRRVNYDIEKVIHLYKDVNYPNSDMMIEIIKKGKI